MVQDFDEKGFLGLQAPEFCNEIAIKYKEWFDLCFNINAFAQKSKYEMNIHNMDGQEVISVCLFLKILNGFQACMILAKYGLVTEAEVLLRSLFEALFIMKACINDEGFMREYVRSDEAKQLKLMKAAYKHDAPIFSETREYASMGRMKELQEKKDRKEIKELNVFDVAEKAGLGILYDSAYRLLSDSVHCGPKSLEDYIAGIDGVGRVKSLTVMPIKAELETVFINPAQVVLYALDFIFEFFTIDKKSEMEPFGLKLQELMGAES